MNSLNSINKTIILLVYLLMMVYSFQGTAAIIREVRHDAQTGTHYINISPAAEDRVITPDIATAIATAIRDSNNPWELPQLPVRLELGGHPFSNLEAWQIIIDALQAYPHAQVTVLNLSDSNIGVAGARALATLLQTNTTLVTITIVDDNIRDEGLTAIADALQANPNTQVDTLNLSNNNIGIAGARALATLLRTNTTLTTLNIEYNNLGDEGLRAIAEALQANPNTRVTNLNFEVNYIFPGGAQDLASLLQTNTTITNINLRGNSIGDEGLTAIANALQGNPHTRVTTLNLMFNDINAVGAQTLATLLQTNHTLTVINLAYNEMGYEGLTAIATALACHNLTLLELTFDGYLSNDDNRLLTRLQTFLKRNRLRALLQIALKRNRLLARLSHQLRHTVPLTLAAPTWRTNNMDSNREPSLSPLGALPSELIRHIMTFIDTQENIPNHRELLQMIMNDTIAPFGILTNNDRHLITEIRGLQEEIIQQLQNARLPLPPPELLPIQEEPGILDYHPLSICNIS